jgi:SAM-dependent methyltransferase
MTNDVVAAPQPAIAYHIERVKRKLATGVYPTAPAACFCGKTDGQPVATLDRYGLPHRICFCGSCGMLYASPRMTPESLERFYRDDYRAIYDCGYSDSELQESRVDARVRGYTLLHDVQDRGLNPSVVFELGCNDGSMLDAFIDHGCDCLGVDYDTAQITHGQALGRPIVRGGLESLELYGKPADLIIAYHVLEHVHDFEATVRRLRAMLSPTGLLFVSLPSLFTFPKDRLYQNAHIYQFTARTLSYAMECCGFEDVWLTEGIDSLWRTTDDVREKDAVDGPEVYRIAKFLNSGKATIPIIRTVNKFDRAERERNLVAAIAEQRLNIHFLINKHVGREAVILGGGPSADTQSETIRGLVQRGAVLYTIERMLPWCLTHGLMPDYVVAMDAHEDVIEALRQPPTEPTYLVAMQCHPTVLAALRERTVFTFATPQKDIRQQDIFDREQVYAWTRVNAGGSVVICAMSLAMMLGSRRLHIVGFDCQLTERQYAEGIAGVGEASSRITIQIDGHDQLVTTTLPYLAFAQQFLELMELCRREDRIDRVTIYGTSLVQAIARTESPVSQIMSFEG